MKEGIEIGEEVIVTQGKGVNKNDGGDREKEYVMVRVKQWDRVKIKTEGMERKLEFDVGRNGSNQSKLPCLAQKTAESKNVFERTRKVGLQKKLSKESTDVKKYK